MPLGEKTVRTGGAPLPSCSCSPNWRRQDRAHIAAVFDAGTRIARKITYETDDRIAQDREASDAILSLLAEIAAG